MVMMDGRRPSRSTDLERSLSQRMKNQILSLVGVVLLIIAFICIVSRYGQKYTVLPLGVNQAKLESSGQLDKDETKISIPEISYHLYGRGNRCSARVTSAPSCGLRHLMLTSAPCKRITCAEHNLCRS